MGYINFRVGKMKGMATLSRAQKHNQRTGFCENTDKSRRGLNRKLMTSGMDYDDFYRQKIAASPVYVDGKQPRKDAVHALDLEFRVNAEEMSTNPSFNLDTFCDEVKSWVCDNFGEGNVAEMWLHMDEGYGMHNGEAKFAPHIHAVVIPMTPDGRLSAYDYIGSPQKLEAMQTSIAQQLEGLNLSRGLQGSVATHVAMKDYYSWVHEAREDKLPEPKKGESAEQYVVRARTSVQKSQSQNLQKILDLQRERDELVTKLNMLNSGHDIQKEELERREKQLAAQQLELEKAQKNFAKNERALRDWNDVLNGLKTLSKEERDAFLKAASKALSAGRAEREAESAERETDNNVPHNKQK